MSVRIVIVGGGFAGLYGARRLERLLPAHAAEVTLVNGTNHMLYTPLLPGAAAGTLEPRHVVIPLRRMLRRTEVLVGAAEGADLGRRELTVRLRDGTVRELLFDHLVIACGSVSRTFPVPGIVEHAIGFKTLADGIALRNRLLDSLDLAEATVDPEARRALLSTVFVGAGYAGVEGIAELADFAESVLPLYPVCKATGMSWTLLDAADRILTEIDPPLAAFTANELSSRGVEIVVGTRVAEISTSAVRLASGRVIPARTAVWTAGVAPSPLVAQLGLPTDAQGRAIVDATCMVGGLGGVWAAGDCAAVPDPARRGSACPPTAQHAIRQGRTVAANIAAALGYGRPKPFTYRTRGVFVDLGHFRGVAVTLGLRSAGLRAWWLARSYHLAMMPTIGRKLRLVIDWNLDLIFGRDPVELGQIGHPTALGRPGGKT